LTVLKEEITYVKHPLLIGCAGMKLNGFQKYAPWVFLFKPFILDCF